MLQFWRNVKDELEYNLMTQKELAAAAGISYNTLQSWITKDRLPDAGQALGIARALNTSIEFLVTGNAAVLEKGIRPQVQRVLPVLNRLSDDNLALIGTIAGRLK